MEKKETLKRLFESYPHKMRDIEVLRDPFYSPHWENIKLMIEDGTLVKDTLAGIIFVTKVMDNK